MLFSTKAGYGLRLMAQLARNYKKKPFSLPLIAKKEGISLGYLEILVKKLKQAGLVKSAKGAQGGYVLLKKPHHITVKEVVTALEGNLAHGLYCISDNQRGLRHCPPRCLTKKVWVRLQRSIERTLSSIKLSHLIK